MKMRKIILMAFIMIRVGIVPAKVLNCQVLKIHAREHVIVFLIYIIHRFTSDNL